MNKRLSAAGRPTKPFFPGRCGTNDVHVGKYVNNIGHCSAIEENYTALGTNGICFEGVTGIHGHSECIIQVH